MVKHSTIIFSITKEAEEVEYEFKPKMYKQISKVSKKSHTFFYSSFLLAFEKMT